MNLGSFLKRLVLVAVLAFIAIGCSSGDDFEPAPGATVEEDELEAVIEAATSQFGLERVIAQSEPVSADDDGPTCFQVESGLCRVPIGHSLVVALHGDDGAHVIVRLGISVDELEAGDRVDSAVTARSFTETRTVRMLYENSDPGISFTGGPCDFQADREADEGCAWQERDAPGVGDEARAMKSESVGTIGLSAVAFARGNLFAEVEVVRRGEHDAPNGFADDIAESLEEQIKAALSQ